MTQDDGGYELTPEEKRAAAPGGEGERAGASKPGEPGWVPPVPVVERAEEAEEEEPVDPDVEAHKGSAVLGYIFFVIPLVTAPRSKFARFHANQGLIAFILLFVVVVAVVLMEVGVGLAARVFSEVAILRIFFGAGLRLLQVAAVGGWIYVWIMGIVHATNGEAKELPIVGHYRLIKQG